MKILLHIGQSKTGTSAIQAYLTLNRQKIRDLGILYPGIAVNGVPIDMGSHNALADSLVGLYRYPNLRAEQYFEQFFNEAEKINAKLVILSAEHFFGGEPRIWDVADESAYFDAYSRKVAMLAQYLGGHQIKILLYLRPQVDWLASAIGQTIRTEKLISRKSIYRNDRQFFEMAKPVLRYFSLVNVWSAHLKPGCIEVIPYDRRSLRNGSSIADFMYRAGLEGVEVRYGSEDLQVNESLSREYIEVKKILNMEDKDKLDERVIISCLERLSATSRYPAKYLLDESLVRDVEEFVEPENQRLNELYIAEGNKLTARSETLSPADESILSEAEIDSALDAFRKEYSKTRYRLMRLDYSMRAALRKNAVTIHGILHQLKRIHRMHAYRKR